MTTGQQDNLVAKSPLDGQGPDTTGQSFSYSFGYGYFDPQKGYVMEYRGPFKGVGPNTFVRSDRRIFQELLARFAEDRSFDSRNIIISVKKGDVLLRGRVADRQSKALAEELAFSVLGVLSVRNELRISSNHLEEARFTRE